MFRRRGLLCLLAASLAGCASVAPTQVGQMMGTIAGSVAAPGVGGPLGGLVGLLAGMVVQGQVDRVTERRERVELGNQMETPSSPGAAAPAPQAPQGEPTRVWVDEHLLDGRLVAGHFEQRYLP